MSRYFMLQTWVGSHENEPDYNGQQCGERNVRSSEVVPLFNKHGNANTKYFSDEAIAARNKPQAKKKATRSIAEKILPQQVRYDNLCNLMDELKSERNTMTDEDYYEYHAILQAKIDRQWQLLSKAAGWNDENTEQAPSHTFSLNAAAQPEFMQEKKENSVKNSVSKACNSAKSDLIYYTSAVVGLFTAFMYFTH